MSIVAEMYRKYMPIKLRYQIGKMKIKKYEQQVFERVCNGEWDDYFREACDYMRGLGRIETFPYKWTEEYDKNQIKVFVDKNKDMPYVKIDGKNLYFPKRYPKSYIRKYLNTILIEQDFRSSHYYFNPSDDRLKDTVFLDIGAAEGYISLKIVSNVKELIIFECDADWIKALSTTFAPWKEKVTIINKFADAYTKGNNIRIDDVVRDKDNIVLKMDVEGMEAKVLTGAEKTLEKNGTKAFVCTYHKLNDEEELVNMLKSKNFVVERSNSYMFYGNPDISFRIGMARAWKKR